MLLVNRPLNFAALSEVPLVEITHRKGDIIYVAGETLDLETYVLAQQEHDVYLASVTGERMALFAGHRQNIKSIAFSPNGEWLATASFDGMVGLCRPRKALAGWPGPVPRPLAGCVVRCWLSQHRDAGLAGR